jgi:hypothetical protein
MPTSHHQTLPRDDIRNFDAVGCFRLGSKVFRGNGKKELTITGLQSVGGGEVRAKLNRGVWYPLTDLTLAGPNGAGAEA